MKETDSKQNYYQQYFDFMNEKLMVSVFGSVK